MVSVNTSPQESELQVERLEQSFEKVKPRANEFSDRFYENLFTDYPDAKPLFEKTDIKEQSKKLLASLVFVVENLKQPGALTDALKGLGARHVKYGALPAHYPLVGNTLIKTFGEFLGDDWTPETQQAWIDAYGIITEVMLDGADYAPETVQLEAEHSAEEEQALQVQLLTDSFNLVTPQAEAFASSFYENLFTDYPEAKPLFTETDIKAQSKKLLASLVFVVENLKQPDALTDALKGLGARHVKYGALPEHYPLVGNTLIKTFGQYLEDNWTPETEKAWTEAYGVITEVMLDGADYAKEDVQLDSQAKTTGVAEATSEEDGQGEESISEEGSDAVKIVGGVAGVLGVLAVLFIFL